MRQVSKTYIALAVISLLIALGYLDLADAQNLEQHNMKSQPKGEPIDNFLTSEALFDLKAPNKAGIEGPIDIGNFIGEIDSETGELIFNPPSITDDTSDHNWMEGFKSPGLSAYVLSLAIYDNDLIVGGGFYTVGRITANNIARWDGSHWTTLGTGMNDDVSALIVYNGELIAGGGFTIAGGVSARRIARWNGNNWSAIDNGMDSGVNALAIYNGDLIAGGYFNTAGVA